MKVHHSSWSLGVLRTMNTVILPFLEPCGVVVWLLVLDVLKQLKSDVQRILASLWHWWERLLLQYTRAAGKRPTIPWHLGSKV